MPLYVYHCAQCNECKTVLQKMSDPVLTTCPDCKTGMVTKQPALSWFHLKGSGWYGSKPKG